MPLDKMPNPEEFAFTHSSIILHTQGKPIACIIDENDENESRYRSLPEDPTLKARLTGFLNKHDDLGLLMGFKLEIQTDSKSFKYTVYPNEEFVYSVIFD